MRLSATRLFAIANGSNTLPSVGNVFVYTPDGLQVYDHLSSAVEVSSIFSNSPLNPIAVERINAIYAAGGTCPIGQEAATILLSRFINAEQISGRWASNHRRLHIYGFGNDAANSIDIITGSVGSFPVAGGVTHSTGFSSGNGTSGYFDFGTSPSALGIGPSTGYFCSLQVQSSAQSGFVAHMGAGNTSRFALYRGLPSDVYFANGGSVGYTSTVNPHQGIIIANRFNGATRVAVRNSTGVSTIINQTVADAGTTVTANIYGMAWNFRDTPGSSPANFYNAQIGLQACGLGMSVTDSESFTANLRELWQGLFRQSIP